MNIPLVLSMIVVTIYYMLFDTPQSESTIKWMRLNHKTNENTKNNFAFDSFVMSVV
jgi:fucose 4-O-acetylase-like acetyltransferase